MGGRDIEALEMYGGMIVHYDGRDVKLDDKSRRKRQKWNDNDQLSHG